MTHIPVQRIAIVGGGTAGWMTAAMLAKHFRKTDIELTLIDSSEIGTVGVGEATIPTLRRFYAELGMSDLDVMRACQATCKLGIEFRDWYKEDSRFIHPFGVYGQKANGIDFHHYWMYLREQGDAGSLDEYSLGVQLAKQHKFIQPSPNPPSELSVFDWALHFDAALFARLMRDYALGNGVTHIDKKIERVETAADNSVTALHLQGDQALSADLFVDCSGFSGLLIEQAQQTGYEDWSQWLKCDRAVAVQSVREGEAAPYTVSQAHRAGWQWKIPLQHRQGNGHVYCSEYVSDDEAANTLANNIEGELTTDLRAFQFVAGRRKKAWNKNVVAVGLAAGFLEPLESTSIALVETAIEKIRRVFRGPFYTAQQVDEFNDLTAQEYERVRDFIILHYKLNQRRDCDFWRECREMNIPATLARKLEAFKTKGDLLRYPIEIFGPPSWLAIYSGFNCLPEHYDERVKKMDPAYLQRAFGDMRRSVADAVASVPSHDEFIAEHCAAAAP
ncbi:tryptophan halogenase family protein [Gilvimarinus sp. DA14]|uniref:tryptophan halogenase family protein n=1 Tax=Gilvimarinus sp. DA14 TaxID=2956798 RepID=UPI0020B7C901|nr:tryptophan halogenase family protein [Gilvimarinus sp. DA14]UTF59868.1 tryptophan 7-halogenase [Gilvimarinus sp. DA14]